MVTIELDDVIILICIIISMLDLGSTNAPSLLPQGINGLWKYLDIYYIKVVHTPVRIEYIYIYIYVNIYIYIYIYRYFDIQCNSSLQW